jgi:hypothetical protein
MLVLFVLKLRGQKKMEANEHFPSLLVIISELFFCLKLSLCRHFLLQFKSSERIRITAVYFMGIPLGVTGRMVYIRF